MAKKIETREARAESQIYIGPTLLRKGLNRFMVFKNGLPSFVATLIQEIPEIARLIVPLSELERARQKAETAGSYEHKLFATIIEKAGGK